MINAGRLLKGIADNDEKLLFAKALDKLAFTQKTGKESFSEFMDTYKAYRLTDIARSACNAELECLPYGGYDDAERVKVGFFAYGADKELFPIVPLLISYNERFSRQLTHRDFLGSVLGLGIVREKTGDIIPADGGAVCLVDEDIADYICTNLERVGHTKVSCRVMPSFTPAPREKLERKLTVASLRLDAVIGGVFNISRSKAADFIRAEKVFVNHCTALSGSKQVCEGDLITLRGYGRARLAQIVGQTKKDRLLINIETDK